MRVHLLLPMLMLAGCAWGPGEGFAVLEPTVRAAYSPEASRDVGDGYQQLSSDYQVRVTAATMRLERIELISRGVRVVVGRFDPANPPPGYGLCHGGHCHRDDGALIPYEDIEAELGGGLPVLPVVTLPVGDLDLLAPETRAVACEPGCELPQTEVSRGRWAMTALRLEGTVRDGRATPRFTGKRPFRLELASAAGAAPVAVLDGELEVPSDRAHEPRVLLGLRLDFTSRIFDGVDWAATTTRADGLVDLGATENAPARTRLLENVVAIDPTAEVKREDR